jgi:hypothetical protein
MTDFVLGNVAPGATLHSGVWPGYDVLLVAGYRRQPRASSVVTIAGEDVAIVPGAHRVAANLRTWLRGTHRGVGADHLQRYLDEFVFRFNRRFYPTTAFDTLLGLTSAVEPTAYPELRGPRPGYRRPRRRGRAPRLTDRDTRLAGRPALDRSGQPHWPSG